jgi:DNA-binding NtrC family response regulator
VTKVLVIDDEAPIRLLCRVNLEAEGVEVALGGVRRGEAPAEGLDHHRQLRVGEEEDDEGEGGEQTE